MKTDKLHFVIPSAAKDPTGLRDGRFSGIFAAVSMIGRALIRLPALPLLALIWIYQRGISPSIPALFGPTCSCRYYPTCSHYAAKALRTHGIVLGVFFAARRLLRCTPFHPGGNDPVPEPGVLRRVCVRVRLPRQTSSI